MPEPPDAEARLTRLEEHAGFSEHRLDQLSAEIAAVNKRLADLAARLARLEHHLIRAATAPSSPPGAAGPSSPAPSG